MGKIVAIDYGRVRIGLALSDLSSKVALPFKMLLKSKENAASLVYKALQEISHLEKIIVGHPLLMNGKPGEMAQEVDGFVASLKEWTSLPILLWDERLTSALAERSLKEMGFSRKKRKNKTDSTAATLLLQSYLDSCC